MAVDFEQFKNLTPEIRIKELRKLVDNLNKEIEQKHEEIRNAEHFLVQADEERRRLEQVRIPEVPKVKVKAKKVTIEEITAPEEEIEERRITREEELELESLLATSPPRKDELIHQAAHRPVEEFYNAFSTIYNRQKETGIETPEDRQKVYLLMKSWEEKNKEYHPAGAKAQHMKTAVEQMSESMYQGATGGTYKTNPT